MLKVHRLTFLLVVLSSVIFSNQETKVMKKAPLAIDAPSPTEDLMREHGVLNRLLLIYQELSRRLNARESFPVAVFQESVELVRKFIEEYHVMLEEKYVFPVFEKAHQKTELVKILKKQHNSGKKLTDYLLLHTSEADVTNQVQGMVIAGYLDIYCRMFRPHEARENTDLFPEFQQLVSEEEYRQLGATFEKIERDSFGENGYQKIVDRVERLEKVLGLDRLSDFSL